MKTQKTSVLQKNSERFNSAFYRALTQEKIESFLDLQPFFNKHIENLLQDLDLNLYMHGNSEGMYNYGLHLLAEISTKNVSASCWIMTFKPGQQTKIHNHYAKCLFASINNTKMLENQYILNGNFLRLLKSETCTKFKFSNDYLTSNYIHQIVCDEENASDTIGISLHIYEMPAYNKNGKFNRNLKELFVEKQNLVAGEGFEPPTKGL